MEDHGISAGFLILLTGRNGVKKFTMGDPLSPRSAPELFERLVDEKSLKKWYRWIGGWKWG
jgi:hypothetical protein